MKIDIDENKVIQNERRQFYLDQLIKTEIKFQQISSCRQVYQEIDLKKMVKIQPFLFPFLFFKLVLF